MTVLLKTSEQYCIHRFTQILVPTAHILHGELEVCDIVVQLKGN